MGDMGDVFKAWRKQIKEQKQKRIKEVDELLKQIKIPYSIDQSYTIHLTTPNGKVLFYPTTNKYQHKKIVKKGNLNEAIKFAKNLGAIEE